MFKTAHGQDHAVDHTQSAVAGVAAIAALYAGPLEAVDEQWATEILLRAAETPEHRGEFWFSGSALLYHSCLYAARGLPGLVRRGLERGHAQAALLELAGHPLERVSEAALHSAFSLWDIDANFAWIALDLAMRISTGSRDDPIAMHDHDPAAARKRLAASVEHAGRALRSGKTRLNGGSKYCILSYFLLPTHYCLLPTHT